MGKVLEIGISENKSNKIVNVDDVKAIKGKGLVGEKHFKENNNKKCQITLIEIESINRYNKKTGTSFSPINFLRNIVTEGVNLNVLVGKEFKRLTYLSTKTKRDGGALWKDWQETRHATYDQDKFKSEFKESVSKGYVKDFAQDTQEEDTSGPWDNSKDEFAGMPT